MNCACEDSASIRASVVLPVPGGPQRIIECRRPLSSARCNGLPAASRCAWPMNSAALRGRMRSASGRASATSTKSVKEIFICHAQPGRGPGQPKQRAGNIRKPVEPLGITAGVVLQDFDHAAHNDQENNKDNFLSARFAACREPGRHRQVCKAALKLVEIQDWLRDIGHRRPGAAGAGRL